MRRRLSGPVLVVAVATLAYGLTIAVISQRVTAGIALSGAAREARAMAAVMQGGQARPPASIRPLLAAGSLRTARADLARILGDDTSRVGVDDRVVILGGWRRKAVVQPIKDAEDWNVIGAVALEVDSWAGLGFPLAIAGVAALLASLQGVIGVGRLAAKDRHGGRIAVLGAVFALVLGAAVLNIRSRLEIAAAVRGLASRVAGPRFDASLVDMPDAAFSALFYAAVTFAAAVALLAAAWAASASRSAAVRREALAAWGFLAPSALHLLVFTAAPLVFTAYVSLHNWDLLAASRPFVGLANYREMFADPLFWNALRNTALYSLYVPVTMVLSLGIALALNQPLRGLPVLRALVFVPAIVSFAAIAIVWQWMFNVDYGLLNFGLRSLGVPPVDWLSNPRTALIAVMLVSAWVQIGYQMVIYLAGLQSIPGTYYEAATLDGAGAWARFRRITLPLLRPVSVYLFITGIIWSFQVFTLVYVMTEGGPVHATDVLVYRIYQNAWEFRRMGYASAMSWFLFALLLVLTLAQWKVINRRVEHAA